MVVCPVLPTEVKVQLAYLERVTVEMNIISRSEVCPEDDEDCQVDEQRCNYNVSDYPSEIFIAEIKFVRWL